MKKILAILIISLFIITGCTNTPSKEDNLSNNNDSNQTIIDKEFSIDDISWDAYCQDDLGSKMIFTLTNNSDYLITDYYFYFSAKDDDSQETINNYYDYLLEYGIDSDYIDEIKGTINQYGFQIYSTYEHNTLISNGQSGRSEMCLLGYSFSIPEKIYYDICKPDHAVICYIDNNTYYEASYDFLTEKMDIKNTGEQAYNWIDNNMSKYIPKPECVCLDIIDSNPDSLTLDVLHIDESFYYDYTKLVKNAGYINEEEPGIDFADMYDFYIATNDNGIKVTVGYYKDEHKVSITVDE